MQWAIEQHGRESAEDRGNWPEAAQDASPDWLVGKRQPLAFTALRAYPIRQMRKLCVALRQQSLPLDQPAVLALLHSCQDRTECASDAPRQRHLPL